MDERLISAIDNNNLNEFTKLFDRCSLDPHFDPNAIVKCQRTLLGRAVAKPQLEIVKFLLDRGVDVNSRDFALHLATEECSHRVIDLLLDRGADIDRVNPIGSTAMLLASRYLNRIIRSCLDLERKISTDELQKAIDYYLHP